MFGFRINSDPVTGGVSDHDNKTLAAVAAGSTVTDVVYYKYNASDASAILICHIDQDQGGNPLSLATNGSDIVVTPHAPGVFDIVYEALMADGVAITAGSGTTILTDDTGAGGHAQIVKLAISTDGSGTLIPATADGLAVVLRPETTGGATVFKSSDDLDETEEEVKGTAGQILGLTFHNVSTSWR